MKDGLNRNDFIKLLIDERNFHFSHPHEIIRKIIFSLGATITSIFITLFIKKEYGQKSELMELLQEWTFSIPLIVIFFGYSLILWGIKEHSYIHKEQRKRITKAIEYLLITKDEDYNTQDFWNKYGLIQLTYREGRKIPIPTSLFAIEPDTRKWLKFHDRKIEIGSLVILIGFITLIIMVAK